MLKYTFCLKINISCKLLAIMLVHLCAHVLAFRFPLWDVLTVKVANGAAKIEEASVGRLGFMACLSSEDLRVSNGAAHLDQRRHTNTSTFPIGRFSPRRDFSVHLRSSGCCCCCSGLWGGFRTERRRKFMNDVPRGWDWKFCISAPWVCNWKTPSETLFGGGWTEKNED